MCEQNVFYFSIHWMIFQLDIWTGEGDSDQRDGPRIWDDFIALFVFAPPIFLSRVAQAEIQCTRKV